MQIRENFAKNQILLVMNKFKVKRYAFKESNTCHFHFGLFSQGINSLRKELAPEDGKSSLKEQSPFWMGFIIQGSKQVITEVVSLCENGVNIP